MTDVVGLIGRKRDGGELAPDEVLSLVSDYVAGEVEDAQMAALLMAGVINGFSDGEAVALTQALLASGERVDLSTLTGPTVDKHSTGGVGDVTTLVVAPVLAATGCQVPKLSGRSLGHTGGTLDKLEAIPGFDVDLAPPRFRRQIEDIGVAIAAAGPQLAPADKRLYALRDVTGTVADPALIASSVMSKKLAGGAQHVLLDVKVGNGAFMTASEPAQALARRCVAIGAAHEVRTAALLTQMSEPVGDAVGNALEVGAAISVLRGDSRGPLRALSQTLSGAALRLTGMDEEEAGARVDRALDSGAALEKFRELVTHQGGDPRVVDRPWDVLPAASVVEDWTPRPGVVHAIDARALGEIASRLGAGRARQGATVDPTVGLETHVRTGDRVELGRPAVRIHARTASEASTAAAALEQAIVIGDEEVAGLPLVLDELGFRSPGR